MKPIAEDFEAIAAELKRIEAEKQQPVPEPDLSYGRLARACRLRSGVIYNQLRFEQYAKDLQRAVFDLSREQRMTDRFSSSSIPRVMPWFKPESPKMSDTELPTVDIAPKAAEPIKKNLTGASFLANLIRTQQAAIKAQLAQAGTELTAAMTDLQDTANEATNQVKAVKAETADLKAALGLNSNGDPA